MKKDFENEIEERLNEKIEIPKSVLDKKEMAFETIRKSKKKTFYNAKWVAAVIMGAVLVGCLSYGNVALAELGEILFAQNKGAQEAVDNGYVDNMENLIAKDEGIEIKVEKFLVDNERAAFSMKINFDDKSLLDEAKVVRINQRIKYGNGEDASGGAYYDFSINEDTKEITYSAICNVKDAIEYDNLYFEIYEIDLSSDINSDLDWEENLESYTIDSLTSQGYKMYKCIEGEWNFNLEISDKFKKPVLIPYEAQEENKSIKIVAAEVNPTGMDVKVRFKDQDKSVRSQLDELVDNLKIVDDRGNVYLKNSGIGLDSNEEGTTDFSMRFLITSFSNNDSYTIEVPDLSGEIQKIKIVKK